MTNQLLKDIEFFGDSKEIIKDWEQPARQRAGYELDRLQRGDMPTDFKTMSDISSGVCEIRIKHKGQYRIIYTAKFQEKIYVLTAFKKRSPKTPQKELEKVKQRLSLI